jgi:hypothetical protein
MGIFDLMVQGLKYSKDRILENYQQKSEEKYKKIDPRILCG